MHDRAAPWLDDQHAARLQLAQCLAHRRAADAELVGQRLLSETGPTGEGTAHDPGLDLLGEVIDQRLAVELSPGGGRFVVRGHVVDPTRDPIGSEIIRTRSHYGS